jgi:hypothetical protein
VGSYFGTAFRASGYNIDYDVRRGSPSTDDQCCNVCNGTPNCMASYVASSGICRVLVQTQADNNVPVDSAQCPLGGFAQLDFVDENYADPDYKVYRGPCVVVP